MNFSHRFILRTLTPAVALLALSVTCGFGAPNVAYPQPDPSGDEQYMLELINIARANPVAEGVRLAGITDPNILQYYKYYSLNTVVMAAQFATYQAKQPLAFSAQLATSAHQQSVDQATNGFQGHNSTDGTTFDARITNTGYKWSMVGENVYAYAKDAYFCHVGFNADWGVPSLDHRANIMNTNSSYPDFREVGISCVPTANSKVGPMIVTQDFGTPQSGGTAYLLGVVYSDNDGNGAYSSGEGLGGVSITPDSGTYCATTSNSGGFVIPLPTNGSGTMTITASGGPLGGPRVKTISWTAGTNVKVDFTTNDPVASSTPVASNNGAAFFNGAVSLGSGVSYLSFPNGNYFGYLSYMSDPRYIYHFDMGYEYVIDANDGQSGVYLYDFKSGTFFYTSPTFGFPYLYDFSRRSVVYYYPDNTNPGHYNTNGVRYFYDYTAKEIFTK